jgi:predicted phosphodiesterase
VTPARFAVLGDIHAEDETLSIILDFVGREGVDAVLAVGDVVDGRGSVNACCRLLMECSAVVVRGNHERWLLAGTMRDLPAATHAADLDSTARDFLASLPVTRHFTTTRGGLLLCHGTGEDDMSAVRPDDHGVVLESNEELQRLLREPALRLVVCGHSHRRMVRPIGPLTIINAGTLCRGESPGFGIVDLGNRAEVTFFEHVPGGNVAAVDVVPLRFEPRH